MQIENLINKSTDTKNTDTKTINDMTAGMRVSDYIKTDSSDNMSKKAAVVGSSNSVDMSDTIYARPQAKNEAGNNDGTDMAENLLNDMNQTSENRRNDMIVTASTTTSDDYKAAKDDGYDIIVTETDKIKAVLAKAGVDISIYGDDLSREQLTDITGSQTEAAMLVNQMKAYDIPATDDNIKAGTDAIDRAKSLTNISDETKAYLVRNNMNPTVSNVYKATYSSSQVQDYRQKTKMTEISDELFEELKPQLKQILEEAHIDSSDENLNQCRWLIDEDIAVTPDNVLLANQVDCINAAKENVSSDFYARAVTEALAMGKKATDATMSQDGLTFDMDSMIIEDRHTGSIDLRQMKLLCSQLRIASNMSRQENYIVPIETADGVTGMKLRIVRGEDKKGLVDIFLEDKKCGRVAAYFEAKENSVSAMIVTDDEQTKKLFEDNITMFEAGISDGEQRVRIDVALEHDISAKESKMSDMKSNTESDNETKKQLDGSESVQTTRLYHIAEQFIVNVQRVIAQDSL